MKIAICDDEQVFSQLYSEYAAEYASRKLDSSISLHIYNHAEDLLGDCSKAGGFDICILDVVMPDMNGIELGQKLREMDFDGKIIYLTSSAEYAIDSFKAKPINYLIKPVSKDAFIAALDEAVLASEARKEKSLVVKTQENVKKLSLNSIMYAELNRRCISYHLSNGRITDSIQIRTTFAEAVQELLKDSRFVLCGSSMVVNLTHISSIESDALVFKDVFKAYPGKKACRDIRSVWYDFCFNGEGF